MPNPITATIAGVLLFDAAARVIASVGVGSDPRLNSLTADRGPRAAHHNAESRSQDLRGAGHSGRVRRDARSQRNAGRRTSQLHRQRRFLLG